MMGQQNSCAAVFKTFSWDSFVERQFRRFVEAAAGCDVFISVDETNGGVGTIPFEGVIRVTTAELVAFGLPNRMERGPLLWWSPDYVHYHFRHHHPHYDTYVFAEYDVVISGPLAPIVERAQATGTDLVSLPIVEPWLWAMAHHQTYAPSRLRHALICLTVFSARALDRLHARRREMGAAGATRYWPSAEAFIPTEIAMAGFRADTLARFGDVTRYDWHPAQLETDIVMGAGTRFQHPILDEQRYAANTLRTAGSLVHILDPRSDMWRRLRRIPRSTYGPLLRPAVTSRLRRAARQRFDRAHRWLLS